jgi:zeaxanthin glucosyltransferase
MVMARFALVGPPLPSHLYFAASVGRELLRRGHTVIQVGLRDAQTAIEQQGVPYAPIGERDHPIGEVTRFRDELAKSKGIAGIRLAMDAVTRMNTTVFRELPEILGTFRADMLIADQAEPAAGTVADHLNLRWVTICNGLPIHRERKVPPYFTNWDFRPDCLGQLRNSLGYACFDRITARIRRCVVSQRREWSLPKYTHADEANSQWLQISQLVKELDFPRTQLPEHFNYTGPFRRETYNLVEFPWHRLTGRPLIYASLGTLQNGLLHVFRIIAEACKDLGHDLVLSVGTDTDLDELGELPGSPVVVGFAPQMEILKISRVFITHAGLNSVQEALLHGVPCVAIPITSDQGGVAARLSRAGAGETLSVRRLTPERVRATLRHILDSPSYRSEAQRLKQVIEESGGVAEAANLMERALDTRSNLLKAASA